MTAKPRKESMRKIAVVLIASVFFWLPIGRAAVIAERPARSTELVSSVPMSVMSVLNADELIVAAETAAVAAGC